MLNTITGYYEEGKIILNENAPVQTKTDVIITFLSPVPKDRNFKRQPGGLSGKVSLPADFNEPLDDLKDYM